jgi:TolB protein
MRALKGLSLPHFRSILFILLLLSLEWKAGAQDWVRTGTNLGAARIRLAAADFNPSSADAQTPALKTTFDTTLYSDLNNAGIFDMVSKSMAPPLTPASPQQMNLAAWAAAPANAAMVAFGSFAVNGGQIAVYGWLFDAKNPESPQILGKQYNETASQDNARMIAHRFADEIITRLGGGIPGIAETHIYYVAARGGNKEIWQMDYDGQGPHAITHLGTISLSPRVSPNNDRVALSYLFIVVL